MPRGRVTVGSGSPASDANLDLPGERRNAALLASFKRDGN
jgi:hypothetical protein